MKDKIESLDDIIEVVETNYIINHPDEFKQIGEDGPLFFVDIEKNEEENKKNS